MSDSWETLEKIHLPVKQFHNTGELRYLEFQGNGENTSSFPKFEIANYDVTRIHVHEQKWVHFRLELS